MSQESAESKASPVHSFESLSFELTLGLLGQMHPVIRKGIRKGSRDQEGVKLSCPGFHGQLIRRLQRTVLHGRLIIQRLMKSFTIVKQFDVLKDFASCFIPRLKVAVVNEFIL
jgi:hypothetical protein